MTQAELKIRRARIKLAKKQKREQEKLIKETVKQLENTVKEETSEAIEVAQKAIGVAESIEVEKGERGEKGEPGKDGKDGKDGYTPVKGKDYFTPKEIKGFKEDVTPVKGLDYFTADEIKAVSKLARPKKGKDYLTDKELEQIKEEITPIKGEDYEDGKDGKDGTEITPTAVRKKLESLKGKARLDAKYIKNINKQIDLTISKTGSSSGSSGVSDGKVKIDESDTADYLENQLAAGDNVTIGKTGGKLEISASASGGGDGDVSGPESAEDGNVAVFDGITGKLIKDGGKNIAELLNTDHSALSNLDYASSGHTGFAPAGSYLEDITSEPIGDLSDVVITTPADNELLAYDTTLSGWINQTPAEAGFATVATSGSYMDLSNRPSIPSSHTELSDIGTNTHAQIDTHIADDTIHFTEGSISITSSQVSDFDTEVSNNVDVAANTTHRSSDGSDHTYIDQDVTNGSSPILDGSNFSGIPATALPDADDDGTTKGVATFDNTDFNATAGVVTIEDSGIDHDNLANTHNLTTDIDHTAISNIGTNSHAQIDTHIADTDNPHSLDIREVLSADRTYYVRTDGSDSNDGLTDSSGGAFLTIQHALDEIAKLDCSVYNVAVEVGNGTYVEDIILPNLLGSGILTITGDTTTPSNVVIDGGFAKSVAGTVVRIEGFKFELTSGTAGVAIDIDSSASVQVLNVDMGGGGYAHHFRAQGGGFINILSDYTISGGCSSHYNLVNSGAVQCTNNTITVSNTPDFSLAFCFSRLGGSFLGNSSNSYSGSATGREYNVQYNGAVYTGVSGAGYFPGDLSGLTSYGGQYA